MSGIGNIISDIIIAFIEVVVVVLENVLGTEDLASILVENGFNIYIFSDSGWFTEPIPIYYMIIYIIIILLFIFLIRLLWKGTKKFIRLVLGVFRL